MEELRSALRDVPPNIFTQVAPSKKGKVLSIPGLIRYCATDGVHQDIWQDRTRGGKVIRCVSLVLDTGLFATEEDLDECFFPVSLALAQAFTAERYSLSIVHAQAGVIKGLSQILGEESWSKQAKNNVLAMCKAPRHGSCSIEDALLQAAALLLRDGHAQRAQDQSAVRHIILLTHKCCTDTSLRLSEMWTWLDGKQIHLWTVTMGKAATATPVFASGLTVPSLWHLPALVRR